MFNYCNINKTANLEWTNNTCEVLHRHLKELIYTYHFKISYFVEMIKEYAIICFEKSIKDLALINNNNNYNINIYLTILEFIKEVYYKYQQPITYDIFN